MLVLTREIAFPGLVLLSAVVVLAGCGGTNRAASTATSKSASTTEGTLHGIVMFPPPPAPPGDEQSAVIHVGSVPITRGTYVHLANVFTPRIASYEPKSRADCSSVRARSEATGSAQELSKLSTAKVQALCVRQKQRQVKESALKTLISDQWLIDEAAEAGVGVSEAQAKMQVQKYAAQQFKSKAEFQHYLATATRTLADVTLEIRTSMASERIQEVIQRKAAEKVDGKAIARYYHEHKSSFAKVPSGRTKLDKKIEGQVREALSKQFLEAETANFIAAFRRKWLARTSCDPGYVISRCREWRGGSRFPGEATQLG